MESQKPRRRHAAPAQDRILHGPGPKPGLELMEGVHHREPYPVHDAPYQKAQVRAVPQPAKGHRDDQVEVAVSPAAAAERDIDISDKKAGKRYMPSLP